MDLNEILNKTKEKTRDKDLLIRTANIATGDRPYREQKSHSSDNGKQTADKTSEFVIEAVAINSTHVSKPFIDEAMTDSGELFLIGNEQKIYDFIVERLNPETRQTSPITKKDILVSLKIKEKSIKKTIERLLDKRAIKIHSSKDGRFGWRIFHI